MEPVPRRRSAAAASRVAKANRHCHILLSRAWGARGGCRGREGAREGVSGQGHETEQTTSTKFYGADKNSKPHSIHRKDVFH